MSGAAGKLYLGIGMPSFAAIIPLLFATRRHTLPAAIIVIVTLPRAWSPSRPRHRPGAREAGSDHHLLSPDP